MRQVKLKLQPRYPKFRYRFGFHYTSKFLAQANPSPEPVLGSRLPSGRKKNERGLEEKERASVFSIFNPSSRSLFFSLPAFSIVLADRDREIDCHLAGNLIAC